MKKYFNEVERDEFEQHWHESQSWSEEGYYTAAGCAIGMLIIVMLAIIVN